MVESVWFLVVCSYSPDKQSKCLVFKPCDLFSITCCSRLSFIFLSVTFLHFNLLLWSHCYKTSTVVITNWLTVTIYPFLKWQWIFPILHRFFLKKKSFSSSITNKILTGLDYMAMVTGVFLETGTAYLWWVPRFTPDFLVGSVLLIFLIIYDVFFCPILVMSLDCPFLIVPLVFSSIYHVCPTEIYWLWPSGTFL